MSATTEQESPGQLAYDRLTDAIERLHDLASAAQYDPEAFSRKQAEIAQLGREFEVELRREGELPA